MMCQIKYVLPIFVLIKTYSIMSCIFGIEALDEDDGNSASKLGAPKILLSIPWRITQLLMMWNLRFFNVKTGLDGATNAIPGFLETNDSSKAYYDANARQLNLVKIHGL